MTMTNNRRIEEYTDSEGKTHFRPKPEDFESTMQWLRADNAFSDKLACLANKAFAKSFRVAISDLKEGQET